MITRSLEKARYAFKSKDVQATIDAHEAKNHGEVHNDKGPYIKSLVYGGLDGIITTFAVVSGSAGASLSSGVVLILGFANLIADGLSMSVGDFLSTKAENEYHKKERKREEWEVENNPKGEIKEMVELYMEKGYSEQDAKKVVDLLFKKKKAFIDTMMVEELKILESHYNPIKNALITFFSFTLFGFIPLLIFVIDLFKNIASTFIISAILTGLTLFALGTVKAQFSQKAWYKSAFEMLLIGGIAAAAAYWIGELLAGLA